MRKKSSENLFEQEQAVLQSAWEDLAQPRFSGNELLSRYESLANHYQKLLTVTKKIFHISDSQGNMLQRQQNDIQLLLDNANQGFLTFGADLKVDRQYSAACARIFEKNIAGVSIVHLLGQENASLQTLLTQTLNQLFDRPLDDETPLLAQLPSTYPVLGKSIHVEIKRIHPHNPANESVLIMMILTDITEKLQAMDQIRYLSFHDKLTGLFNRAYLESMIPELEKSAGTPFSVIMADMNGLKLANDVFGHQQGDLLLAAMSGALTSACRPTDIVCRWGGDEFVVLLPSATKKDCSQLCARIQKACEARSDLAIPLSAGLGAATQDSGLPNIMEMLRSAEHKMYNDKLLKGKLVRNNIAATLINMLISRSGKFAGHQERIKRLAMGFAAFLGLQLDAADQRLLHQLSQLHDIGMVVIPVELLESPRPLTPHEWETVKTHSEIGYRMAQSIGEPALADTILALHERWDGSGYPCGLKEEQIPLWARLFSLVDIYDVLTHDRPYGTAMEKAAALHEIEAGRGSQFDPRLAMSFLEYMKTRE